MLSGRGWRSFAARGNFAAFDRADHSRLNDPQRHAGLLCGANPSQRAPRQKKNIRSILTWE
jgi:hypothetical protein